MSGSMRFGSVCSGIEAASVAWGPLGWKAAWLSEIEPFPCAVLKHHYPDVPNYGDMTLLPARITSGEVEAPDLFCGGTPCQAFSVAGLRNSLDDARGNLSLTFCEIANAIDDRRSVRGESPSIVFWENVPGVLNTKDNAFGCFLGALAGEDEALIAPGDKWSNAGCVYGPQRTVAWRVLDAQYFGVAQRRRRVFVVASARDDINPAEILFEFEGVRRDTAPSRETGKSFAASTERGTASGKSTFGTLMANVGTKLWLGNQEALSGDYHVLEPIAFENSRRDGARLYDNLSNTLQAFAGTGGGNGPMVAQPIAFPANLSGTQHASTADLSPSMGAKNFTAIAYSFDSLASNSMKSSNPHSGCRETDLAKTVDTFDPNPSKNQGGIAVMQPIPIHDQATRHAGKNGEKTMGKGNGLGIGQPGDPMNTLTKGDHHAVAYNIAPGKGELKDDIHVTDAYISKTIDAFGSNPSMHQGGAAIVQTMAVRRLTPTECERLQGFPDGYTNIPWRKASEAPDGPRYKALGNSWAVPVVRWIGERIARAT